MPYIKSDKVFICPSETVNATINDDFRSVGNPGGDVLKSYIPIMEYRDYSAAVNSGVMNDYDQGTSLASIDQPSNTIWLTEAGPNVNAQGVPWDNPARNIGGSGPTSAFPSTIACFTCRVVRKRTTSRTIIAKDRYGRSPTVMRVDQDPEHDQQRSF